MLSSRTPQIQLEEWTLCAKETLRLAGHVPADSAQSISKFSSEALRTAVRMREINRNNAFAMLPPVLLKRILRDSLVRVHDVLAVSQTCHRLRSLILDSPELWNKMTILSPYAYQRLRLDRWMIDRSKPGPLQMALFVASLPDPPGWTEACCQIMTENMERLSRLELYTEMDVPPGLLSEDQGPGFWPPLIAGEEHQDTLQRLATYYALEQPAPLLREFVMHRQIFMPRPPLILPRNIFRGEAPLLRSCIMGGIVLSPHGYRAFANLVSLHYHTWHNTRPLLLDDIGSLLDSLPSLEMICFARHGFSTDSSFPTFEPDSLVTRTALKVVRILRGFAVDMSFVTVHSFFRARGMQRFEIDGSGMLFVQTGHLAQIYPRIDSMTIRLRYIEIRSAGSTVHLGREQSLFLGVWEDPQLYRHLEDLTIDENYWPQDTALPAAPCLTSLCIVLSGCADYRWCLRSMGTPWILNTAVTNCSVFHADHPWACPALRSVHLAYCPPKKDCKLRQAEYLDAPAVTACCCAKTLTISLRDVHRFVTKCLCFEGDRLAVLKLSGVEPIDPEAHGLLSGLAEDIQISSLVDWNAVTQVDAILKCREYHPGTQ